MIILRQSYYSDPQQEDGGSNKLVKGLAGAGATVAAFYGARKGMLGNSMQKWTNTLWGNAGKQVSKLGTKVGDNWAGNWLGKRGGIMINSSAKEWGIANAAKNNTLKDASGALNKREIIKGAQEFKNKLLAPK